MRSLPLCVVLLWLGCGDDVAPTDGLDGGGGDAASTDARSSTDMGLMAHDGALDDAFPHEQDGGLDGALSVDSATSRMCGRRTPPVGAPCNALFCDAALELRGTLGEGFGSGLGPESWSRPGCGMSPLSCPLSYATIDGGGTSQWMRIHRFCNPYSEPMFVDLELEMDERDGGLNDATLIVYEGYRSAADLGDGRNALALLCLEAVESPRSARVPSVRIEAGATISVVVTSSCLPDVYPLSRAGGYSLRVAPVEEVP